MSPSELLVELRSRGIVVAAKGGRLHVEAPKGVITPEVKASLANHKAALLALLSQHERPVRFDLEASPLVAAKFVNTAIGDVWVVVDDEALAEHPDILRSGLPVFYFGEVPYLAGRTAEDLSAIARIKAVFPKGRVLQ